MERQLMESSEIHIIPNLNPDGYARAIPGSCFGKEGRYNPFSCRVYAIRLVYLKLSLTHSISD